MLPCFIRELSSEISRASLSPVLQHHAQLAWLADTLSRKEQHHALIVSSHSEKWHATFSEGFALTLANAPLPASLKQAHCFYFEGLATLHTKGMDTLAPKDNRTIIVILSLADTPPAACDSLQSLLYQQMQDHRWRFVLLAPRTTAARLDLPQGLIASTVLAPFSTAETLALLKHERTHLEQYHQVIIPDDAVTTAYMLASRWLPGSCLAEKALQLLDSAAARATFTSSQGTTKPVVTPSLLNLVTSDWTGIPTPCLQGNRLAGNALPDTLRKEVFGQEEAIRQIVRLLQTACLQFETASQPFCHFLLAGPPCSGKRTLATTLARYLTGKATRLITVSPDATRDALVHAIQQLPCTVFLIENVDALSQNLISLIHEILTTGTLDDGKDSKADFSHAILIFTLSSQIAPTSETLQQDTGRPESCPADLMQLVLGQRDEAHKKSPLLAGTGPFSAQPPLPAEFPDRLKKHMHTVLFKPLNAASMEKMLHHQATLLTQQIEKRMNLSLDVLPEVIRFLSQALQQDKERVETRKAVEHFLLPCIAQALQNAPERQRPDNLQLRLNANGDTLICDAVMAPSRTE